MWFCVHFMLGRISRFWFLEFIIPVDLITMPHGKKNKKQHTLNVQPQEVNNELKPAFSVSVALSFCLIN